MRTLFATVHRKKRDKLIKVLKELLDRRAKGGIERVKVALRLKLLARRSRPVDKAENTAAPVEAVEETGESQARVLQKAVEGSP